LLAAAAGDLAAAENQQAGGTRGGRARHHRDSQHRLPHAARLRHRPSGTALDRAAGAGYCVIRMTELALSSLKYRIWFPCPSTVATITKRAPGVPLVSRC